MMYLFLGFILSFLAFLEIIARDKRIFKFLFFALLLVLILFVSLRDGSLVGTDSPAYYRFYSDINPSVEVGYKFLNISFFREGFSYNFFLFFINALVLFNIGKYIRLNSFYLIFPLFIYYSDFYFYYNFSGIRQAIAMSFTALSVYYIFNNKKNIALFLIGVASLFHVSSLIFLLTFFIPKEKIETRKYLKFLTVMGAGVFFGSYVIESIPYLSQKFIYYSSLQEQSDNIVSNYYFGILKRLIVIISVVLVYRGFFDDDKNVFLYNLYLVGFIIYAVSYLVSPEFGVRLGSYFIILDCILIARYIYVSKSLTNRMVFFIIFVLIAFYKIYTYTLIPAYEYKFIGL